MLEIRCLPPADPLEAVGCVRNYRARALASPSPHGPQHDCFMCADARANFPMVPLEPVLARAARRMSERDAGIVRIGGAA